MADPNEDNIKEIKRRLKFFTEVPGAELSEKQIKSVLDASNKLGKSFGEGSKKSKEYSAGLLGISNSAKAMRNELGSTAVTIAAVTAGMSKLVNFKSIIGSGFMAIGAKEVDQYYKSLLTVTQQFNKYGEGAAKLEQYAKGIGKQFGFTREEALSLMSTIEQGFNYKPVKDMANYMKFLENSVGANDRAMAAYSQRIAGMSSQMIGLQEILNKDISKDGLLSSKTMESTRNLAIALGAVGNISKDDLKFALDFTSNNQAARQGAADKRDGLGNSDRERFAEANRSLKSMQEIERTVNEIAISAGEKLRPVLNGLDRKSVV